MTTLPPRANTIASGKITIDLLIGNINKKLNKGEKPIPLGQDFKDVAAPLRIEIEELLSRVLRDPARPVEQRNIDRVQVVTEYLVANYPDNRKLHRLVLNDLESYQMWEHTDA